MKNRRMLAGCGCEYCCSLAGIATVPVPAEWSPHNGREEILSRQTYRSWLERNVRTHGEFLSRKYGESFA